MARGSALSRAIDYFKTADIEEARFVFQRAGEIMKERVGAAVPEGPQKVRKARKLSKKAATVNASSATSMPVSQEKSSSASASS